MTLSELEQELSYGSAPEASDRVSEWLKENKGTFGHWIGGTWVHQGELFPTYNPATGDLLARVHGANSELVDRSVAAATGALEEWSTSAGYDRARVLYSLGRLIQKRSRFLAVLESLDNGKPIRESRDIDVPLAARHFTYHAGWSQIVDSRLPGYRAIGVCGQIIPWNFPLLMLAWKIAPALACGNTVVIKPAELSPLTAIAFAEICEQAGLPPGVVNIVHGGPETGQLIVEHPGIQKIAFTGSTAVGREIRRRTAGSGKCLTLELGGKSPFIVFPDADIDSAIEGLVDAIWFNQGEVCCAGSHLLIQEGIVGTFLPKLKARMAKLRLGSPLDKAVDMGSLISAEQRQRVCQLIEAGRAEGGEVWQPSVEVPDTGAFIHPTLISGVAPSSTVAQEEIFGPVLVSLTFRTPSEAIELANNTSYGLAASVWSQDLDTALDVAKHLEAGTVWINSTNLFDAGAGFGGYKESGYGREGGLEGLRSYLKAPECSADEEPKREVTKPHLIDRTLKLYIGGKHIRPDSGNSYQCEGVDVPLGNRKDVRNAVEAATAASIAWGRRPAPERSQIIQFLAENLIQRSESMAASSYDVVRSAEEVFRWAAWADKNDGEVHSVPGRYVTLAMKEPYGVIAIIAPSGGSLRSIVRASCCALAMGNGVIWLASESNPVPAFDLAQVISISDVPAGCWNLLSGPTKELASELASHEEIDAVWCFESRFAELVERESAGNLKSTWIVSGKELDVEYLARSVRTKNIWIPYGS